MPATHARPDEADRDRQALYTPSNFGAGRVRDIASLASIAKGRLSAGDANGAFALADRLCRLIVPSARELFLRARAHRAAGRIDAAQRDLGAAIALDPTDFAIDRAALAWGDDASRLEAAQRIASRAKVDPALRREAAHILVAEAGEVAHQLERSQHGVSGWLAWPAHDVLRIEIRGADSSPSFIVDPDPDHPLSAADVSAADIIVEADVSEPATLELFLGDEAVQRVSPVGPVRTLRQTQGLRRATASPEEGPYVTIIVPVYEDLESTRACLESLERARPAFAHRVVVVDDASPNPDLKDYIDDLAAAGAVELLRHQTNIGFAAAVNSALALRPVGDVLLLNSDVVLPEGAVDRLAALSRSSPDVGTVTPFSNNGELASYPLPNEANPLPDAEALGALDALARSVNGDALVDLPNGVGFCLYITQACLELVGDLPEIYAQGYYEDVEFCLAARDRGLRNVIAPGVYVGHCGSKSFGARKRALVMRNLELIEARYPGYRLETAAFVAIDPLRAFRAALDAAAPPAGPVHIVACGSGTLGRRRAERLKAEAPDATVLLMEGDARGRSTNFSAVGGGAPQSLRFDFDDGEAREAFVGYFGKLDIRRVELLDPASLPETALTMLIAVDTEIVLLCGDLRWFSAPPAPSSLVCGSLESPLACEACRGSGRPREHEAKRNEIRRLKLARTLERTAAVVPLDRLSEAFARRVFRERAGAVEALFSIDASQMPPRPSIAAVRRLGVLCPHPSPNVDRLLLRVARRLAKSNSSSSLVVFGAGVDDAALMATDKLFVTGPAVAEEYADLARCFDVDALLAPDRSGGFGDLDATGAALGLRKAYFDWSFGAFPVEAGDLSLDPRICDDKAAAQIVAWLNLERRPGE